MLHLHTRRRRLAPACLVCKRANRAGQPSTAAKRRRAAHKSELFLQSLHALAQHRRLWRVRLDRERALVRAHRFRHATEPLVGQAEAAIRRGAAPVLSRRALEQLGRRRVATVLEYSQPIAMTSTAPNARTIPITIERQRKNVCFIADPSALALSGLFRHDAALPAP